MMHRLKIFLFLLALVLSSGAAYAGALTGSG